MTYKNRVTSQRNTPFITGVAGFIGAVLMGKIFVDSDLCSKYRNALYGVATLAILAVHTPSQQAWQDGWQVLHKLLVYGGFGVPIFAFLTGRGSYFSLLKNSPQIYYLHRFERVFVPYLIIGGLFYVFKYCIYSFQPLRLLYEISTISFWTEHWGPWFIAMLLPVYLSMPLYNTWLKRGNDTFKTIIFCTILFFISVLLNGFYPNIYDHLALVLRTLLVLYIGFYFGKKVYHKQKLSSLWIMLPLFIYTVQAIISRLAHRQEWLLTLPSRNASFAFCGISITLILASCFTCFPTKILHVLHNLGKISLESYCWNTYLGQIMLLFISLYPAYNTTKYLLILYVLFVCMLGLFLSFITSHLVKKYVLKKSSTVNTSNVTIK